MQAAVTAATAAGVSYFTSAGNVGSHYYETTFGARTTQTITFSGGVVSIDMQWTQPFKSIGTSSGSTYSLDWELLVHGTQTIAYNSFNLNADPSQGTINSSRVNGNPVQSLQFSIAAGTYDLVIINNHGSQPQHGTANAGDTVKVEFLSGNYSSISMAAGTGSGSVFGHELDGSVNVVGAVDSNNPTNLEAFSSEGPGALYYAATGAAFGAAIPAGKPNFLAGDFITTDVAGFGIFAGTSAAAPNAAAAGALLLQINPNLTPADIQSLLTASASTAGLSGDTSQFGAGLINTDIAANLVYDGFYASTGTTIYNGTAGSFRSVLAWNGASGNWNGAGNWGAGSTTPSATSYVTLGDDVGTVLSSYTVSLNSAGGSVNSLTVGDATSIVAGLTIAAAGSLSVLEGATVGKSGTLTLLGGATLNVAGLLRLDDVTGATAVMTLQAGAHLTAGALSLTGGVLSVAGISAVGGNVTVGPSGSLLVSTGGSVSVGGTISTAAGSHLEIAAGGTLSEAGLAAASVTIDYGGTFIVQATGATLNSSLLLVPITRANFSLADPRVHIILQGIAAGGVSLTYNSGQLFVVQGAALVATLFFVATPTLSQSKFSTAGIGGNFLEINVACYQRGTRIATPRGETAIEQLRIGDLVMTAAGAARPIRWIGRRSYAAAQAAAERRVRPVRILAGALGGGLPRRDLLVSPQHALLLPDKDLGKVLVAAAQLVNGASIRRCPPGAAVDYFHLELATHDAILAEGAPAESFVDHASRAGFDNAADYALRYPHSLDEIRPCCAARVEGGPALARLRAAIDARAGLRPGPLDGMIDRADGAMIEGWAHQPEAPEAPVLLEILVDGSSVAVLLADQYRADLRAMNGGNCAFYFAVPPRIASGGRVEVRRVGDRLALPMAEERSRAA